MDIEEYKNFRNKYLQHPITFLTEENLDKLEDHCRKAIRYERGVEHKVVLELLERYKEFLTKIEADKKRIEELEKENKRKDMFVKMAKEVIEESILKQKKKEKIKDLEYNSSLGFEEFGYEYEDIEQFYEDIKKHSKNIMELLEDKDLASLEYYIAKYRKRITRIFYISKINNIIKFENLNCDFMYDLDKNKWINGKGYNIKMKTILTKEQNERNCYRLENN